MSDLDIRQSPTYAMLLQVMVDALAPRMFLWAALLGAFSLCAWAIVYPAWPRVAVLGIFTLFVLALLKFRRELA